MIPHFDLDLEDSYTFYTTLWLIMMNYHTTFGYKRLNRSEDIQDYFIISSYYTVTHILYFKTQRTVIENTKVK